ncbi:MAG: DNA ligase-associated DEXH box helicase, partial [Flavobacteriales bacterium]|nr:DNA ligase-associated DEXH box helicase [Flavobacteriales bacterium]
IISADIKKELIVETLMPDDVYHMPWAGHLGIRLIEKVVDIINSHESTLIFTNTRGQAVIWFHKILDVYPEFAGILAMHHGSISKETRAWVEQAIYDGQLKAVVCTSSLDLGVDFRPVEAIVQVGGPKGVARFVQRAGRSGHQPGATSKIYFLPTNALELIESAALREAINQNYLEERQPLVRSFDVLVQYMMTLAVSNGFDPDHLFNEIKSTTSYESLSREEFDWCLQFITTGGSSLQAYNEYKKVERVEGIYKVTKPSIARKHRLSIGTIVSDQMLLVKFQRGGKIGHIEEYFVSSMNPGDTFWFAGQSLEIIQIKGLVVTVKKSKKEKGRIPSWMGGRLNFSSKMSDMLRQTLDSYKQQADLPPEMTTIGPILEVQVKRSHIPGVNEFLIEQIQTKEGYHVFMFPFEGRLVHEGIASLLAYRMSLLQPISFSLAYNDYGFELLSDQPIPLQEALDNNFFSTDHLMNDLEASVNSTEMARRKFRDIAVISGMIFTGYPGKYVKDKHLHSSSSLIFDVFSDYDASNLLYRQAINEVIDYQLELSRFREVMKRIQGQKLVITYPSKPTPLSFPIMVDRLREKVSSEKLSDKLLKMTVANE